MTKTRNTFLLALFALFTFVGQAFADAPISTSRFNNFAVSGYDTVSYFSPTGPVKGSEQFKTDYKGATWLFASKGNLDKFTANPAQYAPQYGGYCSWAAAHGSLAKSDPTQYHVENGKLYLNYNAKIKKKWLPRRGELIPKADAKYPDLID